MDCWYGTQINFQYDNWLATSILPRAVNLNLFTKLSDLLSGGSRTNHEIPLDN